MLALGLGRRTSVIALEMGACSLRAVQLARAGGVWRVHHWLNLEVEPTAPQPPAMDYSALLKNALGPGSFTGSRAALLLSPPDVEYKLLDVPPMVLDRTPAEVRSALQFELDRQMPWPTSEMEMAAWAVETNGGTGGNAMVVGARSSGVQQLVDILENEELEVVRADIVPNGMIRVCEGPGVENGAVWGILDVGFRSCRLYVIHKSRLIYARVLRGGGRELTETLARELHVEFRVAEQYKRIYGICETERGFRSLVTGLSRVEEEALPSILYAILRPVLDTLTTEIERSYRFVMGRLPPTPGGPLYLVGGGARLQGLREVLGSRLGAPACLPDARTALGPPTATDHPACSELHFPALAPCMGLALLEESGGGGPW